MAQSVLRPTTVKTSTWLTIASGLMLWGAFACSGETKSSVNTSDSSIAGGGGEGGGPSSISGTGGNGTGGDPSSGGDTGTGGDTSGQITGTGGTDSGSCPSIEPAIGASCEFDGQRCPFVNCEAPDYRDDHTLTCFDGAWALTAEVICDEEPSSCPATPPVRGQACDSDATPGPCTAIDACGGVQLAYCEGNVWTFEANDGDSEPIAPGVGGASAVSTAVATTGITPELPECPINPPTLGTSCCPADYPEVCDYGSGSGSSNFGVPAPAAGGASSTDAAATTVVTSMAASTVVTGSVTSGTTGSLVTGGTVTGGTVSGTTVTGTTVTGTTTTGAGGGPSGGCLACGPDMVWEESSSCP